jgi:epoxyqueuosine reductase QueG
MDEAKLIEVYCFVGEFFNDGSYKSPLAMRIKPNLERLMEKRDFENALSGYVNSAQGNFVSSGIALKPELTGMRIFNQLLFGYADAADPLFSELKKPEVIGPHILLPKEWLPQAKTVISIFMPFTEQVKTANGQNMNWPADEWLHAQSEGHAFQVELRRWAAGLLTGEGFTVLVPMLDPRYSTKHPSIADTTQKDYYTSNWSERHTAFICGLGTFGLSRGLITRLGIAGRFISLIADVPFEPDIRPYTSPYEYCIHCGACMRNCPSRAISLEQGKQHPPCSAFLDFTLEKCKPRYGCGKCQVKVPCENRIPAM